MNNILFSVHSSCFQRVNMQKKLLVIIVTKLFDIAVNDFDEKNLLAIAGFSLYAVPNVIWVNIGVFKQNLMDMPTVQQLNWIPCTTSRLLCQAMGMRSWHFLMSPCSFDSEAHRECSLVHPPPPPHCQTLAGLDFAQLQESLSMVRLCRKCFFSTPTPDYYSTALISHWTTALGRLVAFTISLPPANVVCEGYVFTHVCDSVNRGGMLGCWGACMVAGEYAWLLGGVHVCQGACVVAGGRA